MKNRLNDWHFNVIFVVGIGGLIYATLNKDIRPEVVGLIGLLIAFVLKQLDDRREERKAREREERERATHRTTPASPEEN